MEPELCETCRNYGYDEDYEEYACAVDLDEDEVYRIFSVHHGRCPYYRPMDGWS